MTLAEYYKKYDKEITRLIKAALAEDRVNNDVTTRALLGGTKGDRKLKAVLLCKQPTVLAGVEIFKKVFKLADPHVKFKGNIKDGAKLRNKQKVLEVESSLRTLLKCERTALNFIQRMSGIAAMTNYFVKMLKFRDARILHTRKTTPGFRIFEIAAVKTGGGDFHRHDLSSAIMVKDNHIEAAGDIIEALRILKNTAITTELRKKLEIEVKNFEEIDAVISLGKRLVKIVMLDNFSPADVGPAAKLLKRNGFRIEISGGINAENFVSYQRKGIDFYSIGALTHSYKSADISLDF